MPTLSMLSTFDNLKLLATLPTMTPEHPASIEVEGLVREFKKGPRAVDGIDLARRARRDLRLPRAQRRRQVDDRAHAHDAAAADRGHGARRRLRRRARGPAGARRDRRRAPGGRARPVPHRPRAHAPADRRCTASPRPSATRRGSELLERVGLIEAADRKVGGYSGGMKRRLDLALALVHRPRDPLPRRAHDRPRHPEPHRAVGRGRAPRRRRRRDGVPHHAVPRGGRRARRPRRHHRPRPDRGRGHAGAAEGGDRPARRVEAVPARSGRAPAALAAVLARFGEPRAAGGPRRASPCACAAARPSSPRSCARSTPRASRSTTCSSTQPTLDDVFLAKTGRSLEGAGDDEDERGGRRAASAGEPEAVPA